ncbi:AAA-like domain-containing protein [Plectonema cf. radiosum LEGE 06105]|uniref:AAA-like domain-containing protein n=1 Tax=Plectonema cf. radiosum LEGE 06105 TaxID=945769 RepID=A0A8J7FCE5_9CYAN|nr:AAA-like domain-containing protein [Plectonema radiosum]MBE9211691.1 AAA-like domain-containing protein [Plectonema cf. radiosum LEGE 06105]
MNVNNPTRKILLLSANPRGTGLLRLDEEKREIKEGLKRAKKREQYSIDSAEAVRYRDIHRAILEYEPQVIHFCGHGTGEDGLVFEDESGQIKLVDAEALAGLFQLFSNQVECVVLNCCYSEYQALEISQYIDYVVGMSQEIGDKAAIEFAVGFYDALGAGHNYEFAYKLGCNLIGIAGIPEQHTPRFIAGNSSQTPPENPAEAATTVYIERQNIEEKCYQVILQPGALIRIKAAQKMGKTSLLEKLLDYSTEQGYQTAKLDLKQADVNTLADLKTFLQWLCADVSDSLELEPELDKYWQDIYGLNKNCTRYFQKYLLSVTDKPLVFAIDNFERLFEYPDIFPQFCLLLRGWYESAKQGDRIGKIWQKLRLVVVHSTEAYPCLDTNHSPFNVGIAIDLPEFNLQQVENIANRYDNSQLGQEGLNKLMELVGGHPYLIQEAISNLKTKQITLEQLLKLAPTEEGIFSNHLREQLWNLQHNPQLESAYKKVVTANKPVRLDAETGFKLHSMGLVKLLGNDCVPSYDLYRRYFSERLV